MKKNFINVQIQARPEIAKKFQEAYEQSECNSKGDFLTHMLKSWLHPEIDQDNVRHIEQLEVQLNHLEALHAQQKEKLEQEFSETNYALRQQTQYSDQLEKEIHGLKEQLNYFHKQLSPYLEAHRDKVVRVKNKVTKRYIRRKLRRERDVFDVIMNSLKFH